MSHPWRQLPTLVHDGAVTIRLLPESDETTIGPGLVVYSPVEVTGVDVQGYDVAVTVAVEAGRLVAQKVVVSQRTGGPAVTGEGIRALPLAALTKEAGQLVSTAAEIPQERIRQAVKDGTTEDTLQLVARVYRQAVAQGEPPTKTIEERFGLSRAKTGRWVALARSHGFLGASSGPGRAQV